MPLKLSTCTRSLISVFMALVPFECTWKGDHVDVYQTADGINKYYNGIYNVISKEICEKCGNPYLLKTGGKIHCYESDLHEKLVDVDRTFQLGHYYRKNSMQLRMKEDTLNEHIWGLKKDPDYAVPLAQSMFLAVKKNFPLLLQADAIVPVPNHPSDYHADAKALALSIELGKQYQINGNKIDVIEALQKIKNQSIHMMTQPERDEAVKDMFKIDANKSVRNKKILLVDDVLTRGNIKGKCATILKANGADKIWIFVAGRTT
jgi:predicted amidophosphoribosyltransferase